MAGYYFSREEDQAGCREDYIAMEWVGTQSRTIRRGTVTPGSWGSSTSSPSTSFPNSRAQSVAALSNVGNLMAMHGLAIQQRCITLPQGTGNQYGAVRQEGDGAVSNEMQFDKLKKQDLD